MRKISLLLLILLIGSSLQVMAQGIVTYGAAVVSTLSAEAPIAIFTFQGSADDQVTIQAIGISPDLDLSATVQSGTEILGVAESDPFTSGSTDARLDLRLPANNVYLVLVASSNGSTGDFLFKLNGQPAAEKTIITGLPADVPINAGESSYYAFEGSADAPTVLNLSSQSPDLQFLAVVRNGDGQIIGTSSGSSALVSVSGVGPYEITLSGVTSSMTGIVSVTLADTTGQPAPEQPTVAPTTAPPTTAPATTAPPDPAVTEEVQIDNTCVVSSGGAVNIRSGSTTNDPILAQMQPGQTYPVTGMTADWYQINVAGIGTGWVFSGVVNTSGDCSSIPVISVNAPVATDTAAPQVEQPTQAPPPTTDDTGNVVQATPTYTPSYTPPAPPTATYTPSYTPTTPPPQIAPEDSRFNNPLNIQLDSTASVLDFVSYPGGDSEDRVSWDIIGMNNNSSLPGGKARLVISVSCFGDGTDQIQFFTGGQTYSCGSTIVDKEVTSASKTGSVVITAVGGSNTYVQWVLTGTATRIN